LSVTGFDRKTVRKYLAHPDLEPRYKLRPGRPTLLDPSKAYIEERLAAGVWNAVVLTRELKERGYVSPHTRSAPRGSRSGGHCAGNKQSNANLKTGASPSVPISQN